MAVLFVFSLPSPIPSYSSLGPSRRFSILRDLSIFWTSASDSSNPGEGSLPCVFAGKWVKPGFSEKQRGCLGGDQKKP